MTPRHIVMAGGLAVAAWLALFGDKTPRADIAEPVARTASAPPLPLLRQPAARPASKKYRGEITLLALKPRDQLIGRAAGAAQGAPHPGALFASQTWIVPPPPPPPAPPPPPPSAPPLPFTFLGKKVEDGKWEVYLARGEQTYVVREQSTIEGLYRVKSIAPPDMSLVYLPLKQEQTLTIGGID